MAFNVEEFRSRMNDYKFTGLASANKFFLVLDAPPKVFPYTTSINSREMQFFCDTINLPGKNLNTFDYKKQGYGDITRMPVSRASESISCTFFCDSKYQIMKFFQGWLDYIVEGTDASPSDIMTDGRKYREIAYKEDYTTTMVAKTLSDAGDAGGDILGTGIPNPLEPGQGMEYKFYNCHPIQLGAVSMGWEQNDTLLKLPVEFTYTHYETKLLGAVNPRSLSASSTSIIDTILNIRSAAGTLINTRRPRNIQDAIDIATNGQSLLGRIF